MTDKKLLWIALAVFMLVFAGCRKSNRFSVDVTPADSVHIARVDLDLIAFDTLNADAELDKLFQRYPDFMPQYFSQMLELPATDRKLSPHQRCGESPESGRSRELWKTDECISRFIARRL